MNPEPLTEQGKRPEPRNRRERRYLERQVLGRQRHALRFSARVAAAVRAFYGYPSKPRLNSRRRRRDRARREAILAAEQELERAALEPEPCPYDLADAVPCQLVAGHPGDCDPNRSGFCHACGANVPAREGEGTCEACDLREGTDAGRELPDGRTPGVPLGE